MSQIRQTPRSLAAHIVVAAALASLTSLSGCSSAELASNEFEQAGDTRGPGEADEDSNNDPSDSESDGGTETGDGDGDGDNTMPADLKDPGYDLDQCDAGYEQVVAYDLIDAQAELAPPFVRESVLTGLGEVPAIPLGTQPFLNHFEFNYPAAAGPELEIAGELWKPPMVNAEAPSRYRLQYAIQAPKISAEQRPPVDLAIVVDLGPSMLGEPLGLAEEALGAIESALVPGDRVTLIGAGEAPVLLGSSVVVESFGASLLTGLLSDGAAAGAGAGNVDAALELAYETIATAWEGQGQPRVLLISNGHFLFDQELVEAVDDHADEGRYLVTASLGDPTMIADLPLRQLAIAGRGPLLYDRTADHVWIDMQERFTAHMVAVATELEISLTLPPGLAIRERDDLWAPAEGPKHALLGANDTLIFHHELESCAELDPGAVIRVELSWYDLLTGEAKQTVWEQPVAELGFGSMDTRKGAATVAYARALRGYRDAKPPSESYGAVLDAISLIADALEAQPEDADLIEMSQVLGKLEG